MSRSRRRWNQSPLPAARTMSIWRMTLLLFVLGLIYSQASQPATWAWMANDEAPAAAQPVVPATASWTEMFEAGPTDAEEWDYRETRDKFSAIVDQTPQALQDMPAYWMCLRWALAQSFAELNSRAKSVTMSRLWSEPDAWRGRLVKLRLYIRLIEEHPAPENSAGVKSVYELWGWTDESKSLPYCVVVAELPPGLKPGADVEYEGQFVGYFLKWMRYVPGAGEERSSPLLLGRIRAAAPRAANTGAVKGPMFAWAVGAAAILIVGMFVALRFWPSRRRAPRPDGPVRDDEGAAMTFLQTAFEKPGEAGAAVAVESAAGTAAAIDKPTESG
jgi:hypothetical protein